VRCRDKGTFRWFACHAMCVTPDRNRRRDFSLTAGICTWNWRGSGRRARSRLPSHVRGAVGFQQCRQKSHSV